MPRYRHGKIEKTIDLHILDELMRRVDNVDRCGYPSDFIRALIAILYWTGFRISEVIGGKPHKYRLKSGEVKYTEEFPGLLKENIWVDDEFLYVYQRARKHGKREGPVAIPLVLPYVNLIVEQWRKTKPGHKVFPIAYVTFWRILKRIDPKIYPHFFALNRITKLAENPEIGLAQICAWTGKHPKTIGYYLARVGRYSKETGRQLLKER